jgi:chromosome segregation ATPase
MTQQQNEQSPAWWKKQVERYKAEVDERAGERDRALARVRGLESELQSARDEIARLVTHLDAATRLETENARLRAEIAEKHQQFEDARADLVRAHNDAANARKRR